MKEIIFKGIPFNRKREIPKLDSIQRWTADSTNNIVVNEEKPSILSRLKENLGEEIFKDIKDIINKSIGDNLYRSKIDDYSYPANLEYGFILKPQSIIDKLDNNLKSGDIIDKLMKDIDYISIIYCNILYGIILEEDISKSEKRILEEKLQGLVDKFSDKISPNI